MSYQVLARKWRPQNFTDLVGQAHVVKTLSNALDSGRLHHAYLFTGTRGVGKTTLARIMARCLNCEQGVGSHPCGECHACIGIAEGRFPDLIEVDAASRSKVDETRDLMDNVQYLPVSGRYKVYLIDEVHMFSEKSFNALLKTLEEPPPHVVFLLATTEPKKLPITILSRCLQFNLMHLTPEQIAAQIRVILQAERIEADPGSIGLLAGAANGSMRDALSLLDQAIAYSAGRLDEAQVRVMLGSIDPAAIDDLLESLANHDAGALFAHIDQLAAHNPDYDSLLAALLTRLHQAAVAHVLPGDPGRTDVFIQRILDRVSAEDVQLFYQIALNGRRDQALSPDPRSGFEMTLVRMLAFRPGEAPRDARQPNSATAATVVASPSPHAAAARPTARAEVKPQTQPQPQPQPQPGPGSSSALDTGEWQQIIDEMALAGLVRELAGHCVLKAHTPDKVHLSLVPTQEHLLKTSQKERLQKAIKDRFGEKVKLEITVEEIAGETPAQRRQREERQRQQEAVAAYSRDPGVRTIMENFNADLQMDSIRVKDPASGSGPAP
jgi:DNA polymerase-3 subunit gamma/tau